MPLKKFYQNTALVLAAISFCLAAGEITIRVLGRYDTNGTFYLLNKPMRPYACPAVSLDAMVRKYLANASGFIMYDADLGWTTRPLSSSRDNMLTYNIDGIRTAAHEVVIPKTPRPGVLRIAIFGDSFTHGDEREFNQTWGYYLEEDLKKAGIPAEVLNFGVCDYGMDQAYLRWKKQGRAFSPHIVIFGFQPENVQRNLSILRVFYNPFDDIFFSKPRFVIKRDGLLELVNCPCVEPQKLPELLRDVSSWKLFKYEYWAMPVNYRLRPWQRSKLLRVIWNMCTRERTRSGCFPEFTRLDKEPARLAVKIVEAFKRDVEASGSRFLTVYLPQTPTMAMVACGKQPTEAKLLGRLGEITAVIHPEQALARQIVKTPERAGRFLHYSGEENSIVAQRIAEFILNNHK